MTGNGRNDFIPFQEWPTSVSNDFIHHFLGKYLGHGISRQVYEHPHDRTLVIKIEMAARSFQNIKEWETWDALRMTKHAKWLAPCVSISVCGIVLIQKRTRPMAESEVPKSLPEWLSDHKRVNYGVLDGHVVCHDYGSNLLLNHGAFNSKMRRKIDWD